MVGGAGSGGHDLQKKVETQAAELKRLQAKLAEKKSIDAPEGSGARVRGRGGGRSRGRGWGLASVLSSVNVFDHRPVLDH